MRRVQTAWALQLGGAQVLGRRLGRCLRLSQTVAPSDTGAPVVGHFGTGVCLGVVSERRKPWRAFLMKIILPRHVMSVFVG